MSEYKPLARKADIVVQELNEETLVYDLVTNKALALNKTSSMVWQYCDGTKTIKDIADLLSIKFKTIITNDFVWMSLEQLKKENLIEIGSLQFTPFEGLSRREMVRKIGVASIVALPIISSLIAPKGVHAASCAFNLQATGCTADFQCCSPATTCTTGGTRRCCVGPGNNTNGSFATSADIPGATCSTLVISIADAACDSQSGSDCCSGNAIYASSPPCADVAPSPTARVRCRCVA